MKIRLALLFLFFVGISCTKDVEENKLYVVSVSAKQLHVLNASSLMTVLAQPLDFSGVGTPKKLGINPALHQLLVVLEGSNTLVRIGTEPPFSYSPLGFTSYGTGEPLVAAIGNAAQKTNLVLSMKRLFLINEFGATVFSSSASPTPTSTVVATPTSTPSATPTATPTPTPTPTPFTSSTPITAGSGGSVILPNGCVPSDMTNNVAVELKKSSSSSTTSPTPSSSPSTNSADAGSSDNEGSFFGSGEKLSYVGGTEVLVACRDLNQILIYQADTLSLIATIALDSNASPFAVSFLRTFGETGSTVTGTYAVWNGNGTLELISSPSHARINGSPYTISSSGTGISSFASNPERSLFLTGYGTAGGGFVDVRDGNGTVLSGSPFTLSSDCAGTGPGGLSSFAEVLKLSQKQKEANEPDHDFIIYYSCPSTGLVAALTTNFQTTFLTRNLGAQTAPKQILVNNRQEALYVALTGATAPAPGIVALNLFSLSDAFTPVTALTFTTGTPDQMLVIP